MYCFLSPVCSAPYSYFIDSIYNDPEHQFPNDVPNSNDSRQVRIQRAGGFIESQYKWDPISFLIPSFFPRTQCPSPRIVLCFIDEPSDVRSAR